MVSNNRFPAIKFNQGIGLDAGQEMYLFSAPAEWLVRRTIVDQWKPEDHEKPWQLQGYQRTLSEGHVTGICRYLKGTARNASPTSALPIFPTSVLLSSRDPVSFTANGKQAREGYLDLGEETKLYLIDGQHRIEGLRRLLADGGPEAELYAHYALPVTLMVCTDKLAELTHFLIINSEAKNVRTDLAEQLLSTIRSENPELIADIRLRKKADQLSVSRAIVAHLQRTPDQPWFGRIARPNERRSGQRVVSESQLGKSFRHIIENKPYSWSLDMVMKFVTDFWMALAELLPEAFAEPARYNIQRTVGVGALHRLLPTLTHAYGDADSIKAVLQDVGPFFTDVDYWSKGGEASKYSSEGGYRDHAELMKQALQP